jgi:hypothetical protein
MSLLNLYVKSKLQRHTIIKSFKLEYKEVSGRLPGFEPAENNHLIKPMRQMNYIIYSKKDIIKIWNFVSERQGLLIVIIIIITVSFEDTFWVR